MRENERARERGTDRERKREKERERENAKKEDSKCKCIDTCENCKFGVGINNGTANGVGTRATLPKIIEDRGWVT